jgi:hypothetical protein
MKFTLHIKQMIWTSFAISFLAIVSEGFCSTVKHLQPQKNHHHTLVKALPPIDADGSALFTYTNQSGQEDGSVFVQVVGVNPHTGAQCFIQYDTQGHPSYFDVHGEIDSRNYGYPLSMFPKAAQGDGCTFYLPQLDGARLYTSIDKKIIFLVNQNEKGEWTISAPNPLNPTDPNRNILWDKIEFAVNPQAVFINPTAVDNFSLPLHCEEIGKDGTKQSGGITASRKVVFNTIENAFVQAGNPWPLLMSRVPSLVYSPMYGAATGVFPKDFFVTSGWMEAFKEVFSKSALLIDAEESLPINQGGGVWKGLIDIATNIMTFTREVDATHPALPSIAITIPVTANELLAGSGPSWNIGASSTLQLVLARDIACAIDTNTLTTTEPVNQEYFKKNSTLFYKYNAAMPQALQFIDHYSQVLHSFGDHHIYTIPYDDELAQSGAASYTPQNFFSGSIQLGPL